MSIWDELVKSAAKFTDLTIAAVGGRTIYSAAKPKKVERDSIEFYIGDTVIARFSSPESALSALHLTEILAGRLSPSGENMDSPNDGAEREEAVVPSRTTSRRRPAGGARNRKKSSAKPPRRKPTAANRRPHQAADTHTPAKVDRKDPESYFGNRPKRPVTERKAAQRNKNAAPPPIAGTSDAAPQSSRLGRGKNRSADGKTPLVASSSIINRV